jgi:hypothetical protein
VRGLRQYFEYLSAEARKRFDAGMGEEEAARDIALDAYRGWLDEERMIVNVHTLYREFSGNQAEPDAGELHGRMLRWRQARRGKQ